MCCNQTSCACEAYAYRTTGWVPEKYWLTSTLTPYTPYKCCVLSQMNDYRLTNPWSAYSNPYLSNINNIYNWGF